MVKKRRSVKCADCGHEFSTKATKPRCSECRSRTIIEAGAASADTTATTTRAPVVDDNFSELQHETEALDPTRLSFNHPPGTWIVNFIESKGIALADDEAVAIQAQFRDGLPDVQTLDFMLQRTFGLQPPKIQRICMVYGFMSAEYLDYNKQEDEVFNIPQGTIPVPGYYQHPQVNPPQVQPLEEADNALPNEEAIIAALEKMEEVANRLDDLERRERRRAERLRIQQEAERARAAERDKIADLTRRIDATMKLANSML